MPTTYTHTYRCTTRCSAITQCTQVHKVFCNHTMHTGTQGVLQTHNAHRYTHMNGIDSSEASHVYISHDNIKCQCCLGIWGDNLYTHKTENREPWTLMQSHLYPAARYVATCNKRSHMTSCLPGTTRLNCQVFQFQQTRRCRCTREHK